jgi:hypothetical protein
VLIRATDKINSDNPNKVETSMTASNASKTLGTSPWWIEEGTSITIRSDYLANYLLKDTIWELPKEQPPIETTGGIRFMYDEKEIKVSKEPTVYKPEPGIYYKTYDYYYETDEDKKIQVYKGKGGDNGDWVDDKSRTVKISEATGRWAELMEKDKSGSRRLGERIQDNGRNPVYFKIDEY